MPKAIRYIIVHNSASLWGNREVIEEWHKARGWKAIGYHYLILNPYPDYIFLQRKMPQDTDGRLVFGRDLNRDGVIDDEVGAHTLGYNGDSLGICLIGKKVDERFPFTNAQMDSLYRFLTIKSLQYEIPVDHLLGHYETPQSQGKTCPDLDMDQVRATVADRQSFRL